MTFLSRSLTMTALATLAALTNAGPRRGANTPVPAPAGSATRSPWRCMPSSSQDLIGVVGYDDNCGENPRSPIHGTAVINPDGASALATPPVCRYSVYGRSDVGLQTNVEWPANSDVGSWTDDDGNSGTFLFDILDQKSG